MYGGIPDAGMEHYPPRVCRNLDVGPRGKAPRTPALRSQANRGPADGELGFRTVRGGIDSGHQLFRLRVVGVVDIWNDLRSGDGTLSSQGARDIDIGPRGNAPRALAL